MDPKCLMPGDSTLIENIVNYLKAKGIFDEFRHECLADVDTKSSCQNLSQRVDGYTSKFLANETWHPDLNKNELRNKLRRNIDESGMLAVGADIVVEQVINPKIHQLFLPKIVEVVHQYVQEQTELLNKKHETPSSTESSSTSEKPINDPPENKDKTQISDPIADILSFSYSKPKTPSVNTKAENVQHKYGESSKVEKKKEEKNVTAVERGVTEVLGGGAPTSVNETKIQLEKEKDKIKKEEPESHQEVLKKVIKDEIKSEKKKVDDVKAPPNDTTSTHEENKPSTSVSIKSNVSSKKDEKIKHKSKSQNAQKSSGSANEVKKPKKESSDKSSEKLNKSKPAKVSKESSSPTKTSSSLKSGSKEEKGESSKLKSHDVASSKTSDSSLKKLKSSYDKKDSSKHKGYSEKTDKPKVSKSADKNESQIHHDSSSNEKGSKSAQYSSSYDSSQGSDQEKNSSNKEKAKHFSKHANKEKTENSDKTDKKRPGGGDESPSKKYKNEKEAKLNLKDTTIVEAAKISSRSNSFGSTSSVSSSSNASKDNLILSSEEAPENSVKDKKKKQQKDKDSCQNSPMNLPPPPPPPPPASSSLSCELPSSEMSSVEDVQSSQSDSEDPSSDEEISEESSSDSELESKDLINDTLNENALNSSIENINAFYDIFLYSSSSSEFEGYGNSPIKKNMSESALENIHESDLSVSSVHTSDLSSFDDELSELSDGEISELTGGLKKKLTLKEAQELIENRANMNKQKKFEPTPNVSEDSLNKKCSQRSSSFLSSDDELSTFEPTRSLRRERKLNPRYSSSEYTSIFNCKKESFITKQTNPSVRNKSSSPKIEPKLKKSESVTENNRLSKEIVKDDSDDEEISAKGKSKLKKKSQDEEDKLNDILSSSDEIESVMDKETLFHENNKNNIVSDEDKLKPNNKLKPHNNSKLRRNSRSLKRKLDITESTPVKRPCSRSSIDSSSSEFTPNENKPFNSDKNDYLEEKKLNDCNVKVSNLTIGTKKDLFGKQRANNNGEILGQKDIFPKNSHHKVINNGEKKTNESNLSKELSSL